MDKNVLSVKETAKMLSMGTSTITQYCRSNRLKARKLDSYGAKGGSPPWEIDEDSVREMLRSAEDAGLVRRFISSLFKFKLK